MAMKNPILQSTGSILLGVVIALILLSAIEGMSAVLHPFPSGTDQTREAVAQHVANYPAWVLFLLGGIGWSLTVLVSCFLATRYGTRQHPAHGISVGVLLLAAAALNISMLPYPTWFIIVAIVLLPMSMYVGVTSVRKRSA
jgi:hypothetical protein